MRFSVTVVRWGVLLRQYSIREHQKYNLRTHTTPRPPPTPGQSVDTKGVCISIAIIRV